MSPKATPTIDDLLTKLGGAAIEREQDSSKPFPEKWDPGNPTHPNPITMARFPGLRKPANAASPLIEATHADGRVYTIWTSMNLLQALIREGVQDGQPCAIKRSSEKRTFFSDKLQHDVSAWTWTVTTPASMENHAGRGGRLISMAEAAELLEGVERVPGAVPELVPDALTVESTATDDDIPF